MNLLLTSAGLANQEIIDTFLWILNKPVDQINLLFIPTASRSEAELVYVAESRQELVDLGVKNITTHNLDHPFAKNDLKNVDVIYVCGGNTFYLLQQLRASGLDKILPDFTGTYVGVSAGSIVMGPNIEVSAPWDDNDIDLDDTAGLNIVDFAVIPHFQRKDIEIIQELRDQANYEILELTDNQAVLVKNGERTIIGKK
jgi:dipeptidase E